MVERDGVIAVASIVHDASGAVSVMQITAVDSGAAEIILLATAGHDRALRLANVELDDWHRRALEALGPERVAVQHEMTLTPD